MLGALKEAKTVAESRIANSAYETLVMERGALAAPKSCANFASLNMQIVILTVLAAKNLVAPFVVVLEGRFSTVLVSVSTVLAVRYVLP